MAEARIPVDVFNPGQVFACLGLVEAADVLLGDAAGGFDWQDPTQTIFLLRAAGTDDPVRVVVDFLLSARVESLAPAGCSLTTQNKKGEGVPTRQLSSLAPFPGRVPASKATLPADLSSDGNNIILDHWIDGTTRDNAKFWAGMGGYSGAELTRDALALVRAEPARLRRELLEFDTPQGSSFRFDWRRDYIPLDTGFSLNKHGNKMISVGYPLVELLAAIGLSNARPASGVDENGRRDKLTYRYGVVSVLRGPRDSASDGAELLPPMYLRAALGCAELPFPMRIFRMYLDWPGQANQARAITHVTEETST